MEEIISIHVLRVEDDPHPPTKEGGPHAVFQSTSSVWRTTEAMVFEAASVSISIHVLRVEDDRRPAGQRVAAGISIHVLRVEDDAAQLAEIADLTKFQSTSSVWRTTLNYCQAWYYTDISIHVLRVEDDKGRL